MYELRIEMADNGVIVRAGCMTLVFEDKDKVLSEIKRYFDNPGKIAREYEENFKRISLEPLNSGNGNATQVAREF